MPTFALPFPFLRGARPGGSLGIAVERDGVCAAWLRPGDAARGHRPRLSTWQHAGPGSSTGVLDELMSWRRQQRLRPSNTHLLLGSDEYQLLPIDIPDLPPAERANAARWKVKDMLDYPADEAAVDCVLVPTAGDAPPIRQGLAAVARQQVVARWMLQARQARCALSSIDIPELALRNLLTLLPGHASDGGADMGADSGACGLLHVGLDRATLVMVWQGELCTFRRFDVTLRHLSGNDAELRQALIERLALDLQRTCDAFERQFHAATLRRLWVTEAGDASSLAEALREHVALEVQPLRLREHLDIDGADALADAERGIDFIPAIGAALRGFDTPPSRP